MVAPQDVYLRGEFDLERVQQANRLDALPPPVHVVPQEQVRRLWGQSPVLEQPQQVVVLPVDVPAHFDGHSHFHQHRLLHEDLFDGADDAEDLVFLELDELAGLLGAHFQQSVDDRIDVDFNLICHMDYIIIVGASLYDFALFSAFSPKTIQGCQLHASARHNHIKPLRNQPSQV